jgi:hypothetical protein
VSTVATFNIEEALMVLKAAPKGTKKARTSEVGRDGIALDSASPDYPWQKLISKFLDGIPYLVYFRQVKLAEQPAVKKICSATPVEQIGAVEAILRRRLANEFAFRRSGSRSADASDSAGVLTRLTLFLLRRKLPYTPAQAASLLALYHSSADRGFLIDDAPVLLKLCQGWAAKGAMTPELCGAFEKLVALLDPANDEEPDGWEGTTERRVRKEFEELLKACSAR